MAEWQDREWLRAEQYGTAANLAARITLHERFSTNSQGWYAWLFERLQHAEPRRLLEVGAGPGRFWCENAPRVPTGWQVVVSDFSAGMIAAAGESLARAGMRCETNVFDAESIPYPDGRFDTVLACHMLYHVADRGRALREMARVLTSGGRLLAATNGPGHLAELESALERVGLPASLLGHNVAAPFSLENGAEQVLEAFGRVELHRYHDSLRVTEVEPLLAYVRSLGSTEAIPEAAIDRLREHFTREFVASGAVAIRKDVGVFVASAPRR